MIEPADRIADESAAVRPRFTDRLLRQRLLKVIDRLEHGRLQLQDPFERIELGTAGGGRSLLRARLDVTDLRFYRALAFNGSVGAGESYANGWWHCDDLVALVRLLVRNRELLDDMEGGVARLGGLVMRAWHLLRDNTRRGARRNIAAHYDLGNPFFGLFLSQDLMYSSALWTCPDDTLESASARKLDVICRKLQLRPGDRVLEIGTGWGGFALHAARHYGCHVTTTTISREQHALAARRIATAGLDDRITLLLQDYRDLGGRYDKLVSIEMIEAIGARHLPRYFGKLGALLKPDGLALLQAITIEDHRYEQALACVDFIKRHIFPGSFIPSLQALMTAKTSACDLALVHQEDFGLSYARTLHAWRERFMASKAAARGLGYDERFLRLWEFYLAYCEGGFLERSIGVSQLLLAKPGAQPLAARWTACADGSPA